MTFAPGDEVVCIDDSTTVLKPKRGARVNLEVEVKRGAHYVVRWCGVFKHPCYTDEIVGVRVEGIVRRDCRRGKIILFEDTPFAACRFRPVKRETIEIFRAMCVSKSPLIPVEMSAGREPPDCARATSPVGSCNPARAAYSDRDPSLIEDRAGVPSCGDR